MVRKGIGVRALAVPALLWNNYFSCNRIWVLRLLFAQHGRIVTRSAFSLAHGRGPGRQTWRKGYGGLGRARIVEARFGARVASCARAVMSLNVTPESTKGARKRGHMC